ncbi:MAG: hypothetical protein ABIP93_12940 [Gemmatimonadaceae bacterium]
MLVRSKSLSAARLLAQGAIVVAMLTGTRAATAEGQSMRAGGSMGVSLRILQPVATQEVQLLGFSVDRAGIARIETSAPVSGPTSQVVMTSISSSTSSVAPVDQAPVLVGGTQRVASLSYLIDLGKRDRAAAGARPVQLRIQYLAVAGT